MTDIDTVSSIFVILSPVIIVLDLELRHILQEHDSGLEQCIVISREIDDIDDNLDDLRADEYADVTSGKPHRRDRDSYNRLQKIKQEIIPQKVKSCAYWCTRLNTTTQIK